MLVHRPWSIELLDDRPSEQRGFEGVMFESPIEGHLDLDVEVDGEL